MPADGFLFEGERELPYPISKIILHKGRYKNVRPRVSIDEKTGTMEMWLE